MRDVRDVFAGFYAAGRDRGRDRPGRARRGRAATGHPARAWTAIASGMRGSIVGVVVAGIVASVAFDAVFELFHRMFFPAGSYTFDPRTDRLVQLFPFDFWSETTLVLGAVILGIAALVWRSARDASRRAGTGVGVPRHDTASTAGAQPRCADERRSRLRGSSGSRSGCTCRGCSSSPSSASASPIASAAFQPRSIPS